MLTLNNPCSLAARPALAGSPRLSEVPDVIAQDQAHSPITRFHRSSDSLSRLVFVNQHTICPKQPIGPIKHLRPRQTAMSRIFSSRVAFRALAAGIGPTACASSLFVGRRVIRCDASPLVAYPPPGQRRRSALDVSPETVSQISSGSVAGALQTLRCYHMSYVYWNC